MMENSLKNSEETAVQRKVLDLAALLNSKGYQGDVHINGIEQGSVWQVLTSCLALRSNGSTTAFKDPVKLTHFSYNADISRYLLSKFSIELDHPDRFRIVRIEYQNFDTSHNFIKSKVIRLKGILDLPGKEKARLWVTPKDEKKEGRKINKISI
jgi:hypothetical protein